MVSVEVCQKPSLILGEFLVEMIPKGDVDGKVWEDLAWEQQSQFAMISCCESGTFNGDE